MAHSVQFVCKATVLCRGPAGIPLIFVNRFAVKVGKPSLYIPSRNEDDHRVLWFSWIYLLGFALIVKLRSPELSRMLVSVGNDDQEGVLPGANCLQFIGILRADPVLCRPRCESKSLYVTTLEISLGKESAYERVCRCILAEQDDADAHSQRLAMVSDSDRPSTVFIGSLLTRTGPSPSRKNHLPFAPAM